MILESTECVVYDLGDKVIKEFDYFPHHFERVHKDLDGTELIPKLYDYYKENNRHCFVVEKIHNIDSSVREGMKKYSKKEYFRKLDYMFPSFSDMIDDYEEELLLFGYCLSDEHLGNFGFKDKQLICLDEGCFQSLGMNDYVKEMLS
jgi:hypothetical protein